MKAFQTTLSTAITTAVIYITFFGYVFTNIFVNSFRCQDENTLNTKGKIQLETGLKPCLLIQIIG